MTSANVLKRSGIFAALLVGLIDLPVEAQAQSSTNDDIAAKEDEGDAGSTIDRGAMRLKLLITLVGNELEEATLRQSRLTVEAAGLDQERQALLAGPSEGTRAERRQLDVIKERLAQIDKEIAKVNARLPEINAELAELRGRLDNANGVALRPEIDAINGVVADGNSQWLDSKRRVQEALVYLGGYNALIDGDFGPRTREAVEVYQRRQDVEVTGTLSSEQEAALLEEAEILRTRYGMRTIQDQEIGYRVSYPNGLLPESEKIEPDGRRFVSTDGQGELLITTSEGDGAAGFSAMYESLIAQYDVQYRRRRADWFVVAGLAEEGRIIYDTARLSGDRIVRARLSYPAEWRDLWSPFAVIMFNSFEIASSGES